MMYSLPFHPHFPPRRYSYYPHPINSSTAIPLNMRKNKNYNDSPSNIRKSNNSSNIPFNNIYKNNETNHFTNYSKNANNKKSNKSTETSVSSEKDDTVFEILGIKLHSDDILLICLIFFLFKEGVQDEYLFISLILLLLS